MGDLSSLKSLNNKWEMRNLVDVSVKARQEAEKQQVQVVGGQNGDILSQEESLFLQVKVCSSTC